ncbi:hypothetical protein PENSPDRAFT_758050 [Peniophora sp. CONT]|nr:hypothetical protein PENSPDRAFT_758050 [Peniophora sp. CONT]
MVSRDDSFSTTMTTVIAARGQSSTHRALAIAELLDNIFAYLERHDAAHASQVSRGWVEIGREYVWREVHIWREVHTPCQLFNVLGPMVHRGPERCYNPLRYFPKPVSIGEDKLTRFLALSRRVRLLHSASSKQECSAPNYNFISHNRQFFIELGNMLAARNMKLFPRLTTLRWWDTETCISTWPWFGGTPLHEIDLIVPQTFHYKDKSIASDQEPRVFSLAHVAPTLRSISFQSPYRNNRPLAPLNLDDKWSNLFWNLKSLTHLHVPIYGLTSDTFSAASTCPNLVQIRFCAPTDLSELVRRRGDLAHFPQPVLAEGSFHALRCLELGAPLDVVNGIMHDPNFCASRIEEFGLRAVQAEKEFAVRALFSSLAQRAGSTVLSLQVQLAPPHEFKYPIYKHWEQTDEWEQPTSWEKGLAPGPSERLCAATFMPLHGSIRLTHLNIAHCHPVLLDDDELVELVRALPALRSLSLVPAPVTDYTPSLTLNVLGRLACVRPRMKVLRLYLDAHQGENVVLADPEGQFGSSLRSLWLIESPVAYKKEGQDTIAAYLVRLLPPGKGLDLDTVAAKGKTGDPVHLWDHVPPTCSFPIHRWHKVAKAMEELRAAGAETDASTRS